MNEKRFFYNPDNKNLLDCDNLSHVLYYHNNKLKNPFDGYIRGIIKDSVLYIRVYYPYDDIYNSLPYNELLRKSRALINLYLKDIKKQVKKVYNLKSFKVIINVTNEDLKNYLKTLYV